MNWWYINIFIFALSSLLSYLMYVTVMSLSVLRIVLKFLFYLSVHLPFFSYFPSHHDLAVRLSNLIVRKPVFWPHSSTEVMCDLILVIFPFSALVSLFAIYWSALNSLNVPSCSLSWKQLFLVDICIKHLYLPYCNPTSLVVVTTVMALCQHFKVKMIVHDAKFIQLVISI